MGLATIEGHARRLVKRLVAMRPTPTIQEKYPQFEIGRGTYGIPKIRSWQEGPTLRIGAFCSIAAGAQIFLGGEHRVDWTTTYPFSTFWPEARHIEGHPRIRGDVVIGNDVWIGSDAMIMSGVTVGNGAVIGAGAVVARDVPAYSILVGNPGRVLRTRFDQEIIGRLEKLQWWNWPDDKIRRYLPLMLDRDVATFLDRAESELPLNTGHDARRD